MNTNEITEYISAVIMDDTQTLTLAEICRCCQLPAEQLITMIDYGIVEPLQSDATMSRWQFSGDSLLRIQTVIRLKRDLGINLAGAALALELLDEVKILRQQVASIHND